jgi:hypothetical protein
LISIKDLRVSSSVFRQAGRYLLGRLLAALKTQQAAWPKYRAELSDAVHRENSFGKAAVRTKQLFAAACSAYKQLGLARHSADLPRLAATVC